MRIAHVILTPRHSGAEIVVGHLVKQQTMEGHQVAAISLNETDKAFTDDLSDWRLRGVHLFVPNSTTGTRLARNADRLKWVRKAFRVFNPDIVFAHSVIPSGYARLAAIGIQRSPKLVTVLHSANEDDYSDKVFSSSEHVLPSPHAVVAVSPKGADNYRQRFHPNFPVLVIPNGIDLGRIQKTLSVHSGTKRDIIQNSGSILLLQIGRITPQKRQFESIGALKILREKGIPAVLAFGGVPEDSEYLASLNRLGVETQMTEYIRFLGSRKDIPELLAASDVFLMPSQSEAHSMALLEGLASGKPSVISNISSFSFATKFPGVWTVDPEISTAFAEAIESALHHKQEDRDLSQFDLKEMSDAYLRVANGLVKP